jgi:hypothetical protein
MTRTGFSFLLALALVPGVVTGPATPAQAQAARTGFIQIDGPSGTEIYLDGALQGVTRDDILPGVDGLIVSDVAPGRHQVAARLEGFAPQTYEVEIAPGEVLALVLRPFAPAVEITEEGDSDTGALRAEVGTLLIQSVPIDIGIRGAGIDRVKSQDRLTARNLRAGSHAMTFTSGGRTLEARADICAAATTALFVNFVAGTVEVRADGCAVTEWSHPMLQTTLDGHGDYVRSAAFAPDGRRIVTASADRTARIWDADTGRPVATLEGHGDWVRSAAFAPDGRRIVTASADRTARIWDADTGRPVATLDGHGDGVRSAAFAPDGRRIVTASWDGTARIWQDGVPPE